MVELWAWSHFVCGTQLEFIPTNHSASEPRSQLEGHAEKSVLPVDVIDLGDDVGELGD